VRWARDLVCAVEVGRFGYMGGGGAVLLFVMSLLM